MTIQTAAQNKAQELVLSRNPRALHDYLEKWKRGECMVPTDYLLSVIHAYGVMIEQSMRPDETVGQLLLRFSTQRALWNGRDLDLTMTEFRVVKLMAESVGTFLSYRSIYDVVHYAGFSAGSGIEGYKTNVRSIVKRVRRKFEGVDPTFNQIENYNGFGYRWLKVDQPMIVSQEGTPLAA